MFSLIENCFGMVKALVILGLIPLVMYASGFAPSLDVKGPSKEGHNLEQRNEERQNKKSYDKVKSHAKNKAEGKKTPKKDKPTQKDVKRSLTHERDKVA